MAASGKTDCPSTPQFLRRAEEIRASFLGRVFLFLIEVAHRPKQLANRKMLCL